MSDDVYLTVRETASKLNCSEDTVRRMISSERLPAIKLQQQYRIREGDIAISLSATNSNLPQPTTRNLTNE